MFRREATISDNTPDANLPKFSKVVPVAHLLSDRRIGIGGARRPQNSVKVDTWFTPEPKLSKAGPALPHSPR